MTLLQRFVQAIITLALPLLLMMTAIRLLLTPVFLEVEYRLPGFPADPFGFTREERLHWANLSLEYLLNDADISFLANQRLANDQPLYNERELRHMVDVKNLVQWMIRIWLIMVSIYLLVGLWAWQTGWAAAYWTAIARGGWLTLALVVLILVSVALSFEGLFTAFHRLFFEGDTWLFYYSDTLIRLFPLRFWRDAFAIMGVLTVLGGILAIWGGQKLVNKSIIT